MDNLDSYFQKMSLKLIKRGADRRNYEILKMLPTTTKEIEEKLKLSKMPANKRVNELEEVGLLKRYRYTGRIESTELTRIFLDRLAKFTEQNKEQIFNNILRGI